MTAAYYIVFDPIAWLLLMLTVAHGASVLPRFRSLVFAVGVSSLVSAWHSGMLTSGIQSTRKMDRITSNPAITFVLCEVLSNFRLPRAMISEKNPYLQTRSRSNSSQLPSVYACMMLRDPSR